MYGQQCFQAFGLCLMQLLVSVQHLLHSTEFAAVLLWMLGPRGHPHLVVYLISARIVPPCVPVLCLLFYSMEFLSLKIAFLGLSSPQT